MGGEHMIMGIVTRVDKELNIHLREHGARHFDKDIIVSPISCHFPPYGSKEWKVLFKYFNEKYLGREVIFYCDVGSLSNVHYGELKIYCKHGVENLDQGLLQDIIGSTVIH